MYTCVFMCVYMYYISMYMDMYNVEYVRYDQLKISNEKVINCFEYSSIDLALIMSNFIVIASLNKIEYDTVKTIFIYVKLICRNIHTYLFDC